MATVSGGSVADVVAALEALQAQAHTDALALVAVGVLLFGAVLGLAVAFYCGRWFSGQ